MKISACIITLNEERDLPRLLRSLVGVVDEVVVVDSGSTDATRDLAEASGARVVNQPWLGYVGQKNFALDQAAHPWVLSVDADEELSPELTASLLRVKGDPAAEAPGAPNGYQLARLVFYQGKWIRHGDWYPDRLVRLFRRSEARFSGGRVHERLDLAGEHPVLPGHLYHFTYEDAADRRACCAKYAELWAQTQQERGRRVGPMAGPLHALTRFLKGYVLKRGFMDGATGWDIAMGNAREVWLKYHLLRQLNHATRS